MPAILDVLGIHSPGDAVVRNIEEGDTVRVFNDLGEVRCFARVDPTMRDGIVSLAKGLWRKSTGRRQTRSVPTR